VIRESAQSAGPPGSIWSPDSQVTQLGCFNGPTQLSNRHISISPATAPMMLVLRGTWYSGLVHCEPFTKRPAGGSRHHRTSTLIVIDQMHRQLPTSFVIFFRVKVRIRVSLRHWAVGDFVTYKFSYDVALHWPPSHLLRSQHQQRNSLLSLTMPLPKKYLSPSLKTSQGHAPAHQLQLQWPTSH
jgi:hypothetical protein